MGKLIQLYGFTEYVEKDETWEMKDLFLIPYQEIASLSSYVQEEEFGEEVLAEKCKELEWMRNQLLSHERILEEVMKTRTVVPLKWGSFFRSKDAVCDALAEHYPIIQGLLTKLKGREEWSVKAFVDRLRLQASSANHPELKQLKHTMEKMPSGSRYLLTERLKLLTEEASQETIQKLAQELYTELMKFSEAQATANPVQDPTLKDPLELVFQMVFLVSKERRQEFSDAVQKAGTHWKTQGFEIQQVGPFPPYYFCDLNLKESKIDA